MKEKRSGTGNQSGEIMLEAAIVFVPVLVLLLALLSLGFWFYQMSMMTSTASEIATEVARNIKFEKLDGHGDVVAIEDITSTKMFRSTFHLSKLKRAQEERAKDHADWRVSLSSLGFGSQDPEVELELKSSGIGRTHVKVSVRQNTDFFLSGVLKYAGILEDHPIFQGTAYAECIDLTEYASMVNFLRYGSNEVSEHLEIAGSVGKLYGKAKGLLEALHVTF